MCSCGTVGVGGRGLQGGCPSRLASQWVLFLPPCDVAGGIGMLGERGAFEYHTSHVSFAVVLLVPLMCVGGRGAAGSVNAATADPQKDCRRWILPPMCVCQPWEMGQRLTMLALPGWPSHGQPCCQTKVQVGWPKQRPLQFFTHFAFGSHPVPPAFVTRPLQQVQEPSHRSRRRRSLSASFHCSGSCCWHAGLVDGPYICCCNEVTQVTVCCVTQ